MADKTPLGMEFVNWQNLPSLTETLAGGKSPLLKTIGLLMAGGDKEQEPNVGAPAMGMGVSQPQIPGGVGIAPISNGLGIKPPAQFGGLPSLPTAPTLNTSQTPSAGQDLDGDGVIDSFWGVKK